ncbi:hypothetical protein APR41_10550 [Salegentibacter salinarum]|uniref:DUF2267 domain-containing protein n=1 Tax=Salegentibacter salinarum TaxID=447422 RepID=A0A2N0TNE8_9FLAO|nr:DUF2267 domain-containing protein [Salegentibacter salinarum]PKD16218.1 hypothetical protein APR41_10550 [Salegentibacter salinarum]SKB67802.1 Uncharacterized conserved protein, DUF2267 family [Salegentibacter salinarum]
MNSNLNFETFKQEAHEYINDLATELEHPEEKERVLRIWRSVMFTIRDRIDFNEAFLLMQPLPTILRGIYIESWEYSKKPKLDYSTLEEMKSEVKKNQRKKGEKDFPWKLSTEEIITITIKSLNKYISLFQITDIINQMPGEIKTYLNQKIKAE